MCWWQINSRAAITSRMVVLHLLSLVPSSEPKDLHGCRCWSPSSSSMGHQELPWRRFRCFKELLDRRIQNTSQVMRWIREPPTNSGGLGPEPEDPNIWTHQAAQTHVACLLCYWWEKQPSRKWWRKEELSSLKVQQLQELETRLPVDTRWLHWPHALPGPTEGF